MALATSALFAACAIGSSYEDVGFSTPLPGSPGAMPTAPTSSGPGRTVSSSTDPLPATPDAGRIAAANDGGMRTASTSDGGDDIGAIENGPITWATNATDFRCRRLERFGFDCPVGGVASAVWGSSIYTDDSSICTAAVHDGKITKNSGGHVIVEMRPGERIYRSTTRNGVTTTAYSVPDGAPNWPCSFVLYPW